jgi:hypothetical protein
VALFLVFALGVANFALHKAVLESGHPLLGQMPWFVHLLGGRIGFAVEFVMLLGCLLMVAQGSPGWAVGYLFYSLANALAAWLVLTHRI